MAIDVAVLGTAIRKLREKRGLSQVELARAAGLTQPAIAWIEKGQRSASLATLNSIGKGLGVPGECLNLLGSRTIANHKDATALLRRLQALVLATVEAQENERARARRKRGRSQRVAASSA